MAPLIVLTSVFVLATLCARDRLSSGRRGRLALGVMLLFTAVAHFTTAPAMAAMIPVPDALAYPLVYLTGILEVGFGLALLCGRRSALLGALLATFFVALLPANIYSAVAGTGMGAHGIEYLWFRIPLQALFIGWALYFTRRA